MSTRENIFFHAFFVRGLTFSRPQPTLYNGEIFKRGACMGHGIFGIHRLPDQNSGLRRTFFGWANAHADVRDQKRPPGHLCGRRGGGCVGDCAFVDVPGCVCASRAEIFCSFQHDGRVKPLGRAMRAPTDISHSTGLAIARNA